jgi:ABC-type protease/lipase transport system fused ATPase/permease subunit
VRDYPLAQLRSAIGYVPQETFLFSDTLAENIAFGVERSERADVEWAAEIAGLADDVRDFPAGFDTLVGERGITLSGGQKQRTAIARAVMRQPRILILDDALSSVDTYTEEKILAQLRGVMRERTSSSSRTASRPCATQTLSASSTRGASSSAARTKSFSRTAASTQTSTSGSCSKRNWRRVKLPTGGI